MGKEVIFSDTHLPSHYVTRQEVWDECIFHVAGSYYILMCTFPAWYFQDKWGYSGISSTSVRVRHAVSEMSYIFTLGIVQVFCLSLFSTLFKYSIEFPYSNDSTRMKQIHSFVLPHFNRNLRRYDSNSTGRLT